MITGFRPPFFGRRGAKKTKEEKGFLLRDKNELRGGGKIDSKNRCSDVNFPHGKEKKKKI